jgi:hypothetical protein
MAVLADHKIAGVALNAGFSGNALNVAVAVALAESRGDARAHNPVPPDNSYGLWQINMLGGMGPERRKRFNLKSNEDLFDPSTNARVAYALWKERGNFSAWSTYSNGRYLAYLPRANAAVKKNGGAAIATGKVDPNDPNAVDLSRPDTPLPDEIENTIYDLRDSVAGVKGFLDTLTDSKTWVRVGMFAGGLILVIVGGLFLIGQNKAVRTVASAVPVGRAVKAVKGAV